MLSFVETSLLSLHLPSPLVTCVVHLSTLVIRYHSITLAQLKQRNAEQQNGQRLQRHSTFRISSVLARPLLDTFDTFHTSAH